MGNRTSPSPKSSDFAPLIHDIIRHAIAAVHPLEIVPRSVHRHEDLLRINDESFDLNRYNRIHIISAGKGAVPFYEGLAQLIDDRLAGGVIVAPPGQIPWDDRMTVCHGSHPIPDEHSLRAGRVVWDYIGSSIQSGDLVFVLVTGGASSLMELPVPQATIEDIALMNRLLLSSGADITEINSIRKLLSAIKGGGLARRIAPAAIITLIISDIVDSPLEHIGSGPTIIDSHTFGQAVNLLIKYNLLHQLPLRLRQFFAEGMKREMTEKPSTGSSKPADNHHYLLADNRTLLEAAQEAALRLNIPAIVTSATEQGDATIHAQYTAQTIRSIIEGRNALKSPILLVSGGELTVTIKGKGKGGRNQEFILALLRESRPLSHPFFAASIGTDGIDGSTDAAGAWIDERTFGRALKLHLDPDSFLQNNDAFNFFAPLGQLIFTGPTGANCMDLRLVYIPADDGSFAKTKSPTSTP